MESKTILIGMMNKYSAETNRWLSFGIGTVLLIFSIKSVYKHSIDFNNMIMFSWGIYLLIYGYIGYSVYSRFAPKIKLDEHQIELKRHLWNQSIKINWSDLTSVMFKPYEVVFWGKTPEKC